MSLRVWLRPPRSLLVILFLLTLVSISTVAWFGWRLVQQDSAVEEQRTQERLEHTADRLVFALSGALADIGDRLDKAPRRDAGPVFVLTESSLIALPPALLLYRPFTAMEPEAPSSAFA